MSYWKKKNKNQFPLWVIAIGALAIYWAMVEGKLVEVKVPNS